MDARAELLFAEASVLQQQLAAMREAERSRPEKSAEKSAEVERDEAKAKAERLYAEVASLRKKLAAAEKAAEAPSHVEIGSAGGAAAVRAALGGKPAQDSGGLSLDEFKYMRERVLVFLETRDAIERQAVKLT